MLFGLLSFENTFLAALYISFSSSIPMRMDKEWVWKIFFEII